MSRTQPSHRSWVILQIPRSPVISVSRTQTSHLEGALRKQRPSIPRSRRWERRRGLSTRNSPICKCNTMKWRHRWLSLFRSRFIFFSCLSFSVALALSPRATCRFADAIRWNDGTGGSLSHALSLCFFLFFFLSRSRALSTRNLPI